MTITGRPGFRFKEGKLLVFTETETLMIGSWPELTAAKTRARSKNWWPFVPVFRLLRPTRQRGGTIPSLGPENLQLPALDPELERQTAFRAFRFSIPPEVVATTERFPSRQWSILRMCQRSRHARELTAANPTLGFCLANLNSFRPTFSDPAELAGMLAKLKQRELLARIGFPGTESCVRILAKVLPEAIHIEAALRLREALADDEVVRLLSHLPAINAEILSVTTNSRFREHITPNLLTELVGLGTQNERLELAGLLQDLQLMNAVLEPGRPPQKFQSIAKIRETHAVVSREYCKRQAEAVLRCRFPEPPLPGNEDIEALTTPEKLREEGTEQANCVGTYAKWVENGRGYIYRVLRPERATLAIEQGPDGSWAIQQLRAKRNSPVTQATETAVLEWLKRYSLSI